MCSAGPAGPDGRDGADASSYSIFDGTGREVGPLLGVQTDAQGYVTGWALVNGGILKVTEQSMPNQAFSVSRYYAEPTCSIPAFEATGHPVQVIDGTVYVGSNEPPVTRDVYSLTGYPPFNLVCSKENYQRPMVPIVVLGTFVPPFSIR
jgi:hypothetical protein